LSVDAGVNPPSAPAYQIKFELPVNIHTKFVVEYSYDQKTLAIKRMSGKQFRKSEINSLNLLTVNNRYVNIILPFF
jgi:hypothetical protein